MVILVTPRDTYGEGIEGAQAEVWMRFTEKPPADLLRRLARENPGKRVYCLLGASTWFEADDPRG